jgi:hypothetical protein
MNELFILQLTNSWDVSVGRAESYGLDYRFLIPSGRNVYLILTVLTDSRVHTDSYSIQRVSKRALQL